eukprot:CAMPEP_0204836996 /NCGR_PEP_ID=MMETSP1346-20131115/26840_1 /ASSEMBLY_ACC=CAM_ASM_000771 /TAXON_ID=215587 /ORGANISM="Aplanochytrium stocchinoi, Strain GSBS06" /LENGTH=65 /DNA_ID=CAMNT_0051972179 /DNA_START=46 /DNA_END=243 /DNA_ORIENTATION=-
MSCLLKLHTLAKRVRLLYVKRKCNEAFLELLAKTYEPGHSGATRAEKQFMEIRKLIRQGSLRKTE